MEGAISNTPPGAVYYKGDLFGFVELLHNVDIPGDVTWADKYLQVTARRMRVSKRMKSFHPSGPSRTSSGVSGAPDVPFPHMLDPALSHPSQPPAESFETQYLISAAFIAMEFPDHLINALMLRGNASGPNWAAGIAQNPPSAVGPLQYVVWGMDILARLCEHIPNFPRQVLDQAAIDKFKSDVMNLVLFALLSIVCPIHIAYTDETNDFMRQDLVLDSARMASSCFTLLAQALSPLNSASDGDVDWEAVCLHLLSHRKSQMSIPLLFHVTGNLMVMVEDMVPIMCKNNITSPTLSSTLHTLGIHVGNCVGTLAALCSMPVFYQALMIVDPTASAPLSMLAFGLDLWRLKGHVEPAHAGTLTLLAARCCALLLVLTQHFSPDFLEHSMAPGNASQPRMTAIAGIIKEMLVSYSLETVHKGVETDHGSPQLYVNLLRLAEIFADETNFREGMIVQLSPALAAVLSSDSKSFASWWCGGESVQLAHMQDVMWVYSVTYSAYETALTMRECAAEVIHIPEATIRARSKALPVGAPEPDWERVREMCLERAVQMCKLLVNLHYFCEMTCDVRMRDQFLNCLIAEWSKDGAPREVKKQRINQALKNLRSLLKMVTRLFPDNDLGRGDDSLLTEQDKDSMDEFIFALESRLND